LKGGMRMRVLIVNKDEAFRLLFGRMVSFFFPEAEVASAEDSDTAISMIKEGEVDVLITELFLVPSLSLAMFGISLTDTDAEGIKIVECARENKAQAVIVTSVICSPDICPGRSDIPFRELAYQHGAHTVLDEEQVIQPRFLGNAIRELLVTSGEC
jgi:hypothetical protein